MPKIERRSFKHSTGWFVQLSKAHADTLRFLSNSVDLHSGQPAILCLLNSEPDICQNEIAQKLSIAEASVTTMLSRLEKKGLVKRKNDARKIRVQLTEMGYKRFYDIEEQLERFDPAIFNGFTEDERIKFLSSMERVTQNIQNELKILAERGEHRYFPEEK